MDNKTVEYFEQAAQRKEQEKQQADTMLAERALRESDSRKIESIRARSPERVKDPAGKTIEYFRSPSERRQIQSIKFEIEDLISGENLQQPDKVQRLQDLLNKYVIGDEVLERSGDYDSRTNQAKLQYMQDVQRWDGDPYGPDMSPLKTFERWKAAQSQRMNAISVMGRPGDTQKELR